MKTTVLLLSLCSVLCYSCKEDEPDFERGDILIQTQLEGQSGLQGGVNLKLYILNLPDPQLMLEEVSSSAGLLDMRQVIAGPYNVVATYSDTLAGGTINTYTADTLVDITPNNSLVLGLTLKQ